MWDIPGQGIEPVSPALAGGFSTTGPPGKSQSLSISSFVHSFTHWGSGLHGGSLEAPGSAHICTALDTFVVLGWREARCGNND